MDPKVPTIETLDAAFKATQVKKTEDREKEADGFLAP